MSTIKQQQEQIALLKAQLEALKASGANKYGTWTSKDTGKVYLQYKPSKGKAILMNRTAVTELIKDAHNALAALDELKVD